MRHARQRSTQSYSTDSLSAYLQEISVYPLLTREQEGELARRIASGDEAALDELVCANLRFVVAVAKRYQHQGVALSDLIDEGNLGLMRAAHRFDDAKAVRFISYAVWWVRQGILQALADNSHAVRVPLGREWMVRRMGRRANVLRQELRREPTRRELAADLGVEESEVATAFPLAQTQLSLDAPLGIDGDTRLLDLIADNGQDAGTAVADGALAHLVSDALGHLRAREAMVLRMYFGIDGKEPQTLERIADLLGITRERVRQIKEKGLRHLRMSEQAGALSLFR
jgi:RNA polymerase primary sigma factor